MTESTEPPFPNNTYAFGAWRGDTADHVNAQVSQLICLGTLLQNAGEFPQELSEDDNQADILATELGVPRPRIAGHTAQSLSLDRLVTLSLDSYPGRPSTGAFETDFAESRETRLAILRHLWENIGGWQSARSTLAFFAVNLSSEHRLVRTTAASLLSMVHAQPDSRVARILDESLDSNAPYVSDFAAIALGDASISNTAAGGTEASDATNQSGLDRGDSSDANDWDGGTEDGGSSLSIIVHGTFARLTNVNTRWYIPSAPLPQRILTDCTHDLYQGSLFFRWSAAYSESARQSGADDLLQWCAQRGSTDLDTVFAHSHGGNVVLNAIARGMRVKLLVLLHIPVLPRPDFEWDMIKNNTKRIMHLRTMFDWVVSMDRIKNNSRNNLPSRLRNFRTLTAPLTARSQFSHGLYTQDAVWKSRALTNDVAYERSLA